MYDVSWWQWCTHSLYSQQQQGLSKGSRDQNLEKKISLKFGQINFRKSQKISNRFDNALKSYLKKFKFEGLLGPHPV